MQAMHRFQSNSNQNIEGTPGFEPGTSRSAVECSTTELYPLPMTGPPVPLNASYNCLISVAKSCVRCGIRTHALIRGPEFSALYCRARLFLESGALDHSAILTVVCEAHHCHFVLKHFSEEAFWMSVLILATATVV